MRLKYTLSMGKWKQVELVYEVRHELGKKHIAECGSYSKEVETDDGKH